jgi:hypothetical protein
MSETMTLDTVRDTLLGWLKEIATRHGSLEEHVREDGRPGTGHLRYIFCTGDNTYYIHATPTYLGCGANSRRTRAGEDWHRGSDLPDGPFSRKTWEAIKDAVIAYELVRLEPAYKPGREPCGVPSGRLLATCPTCGLGIDDDGDGNCAVCGPQPTATVATPARPEGPFDEGVAAEEVAGAPV